MTRLALIGLAFFAIVSWALLERQGRNEANASVAQLRTELAGAKAYLAQAEESARVHRAYLDRRDALAAEANKARNELMTMEGGDAPLSPYLDAAADRLWGKGGE